MRELDIYLLSGMHPIYSDLVKFPPDGVRYTTNIDKKDFQTLRIYSDKRYIFKKNIAARIMNFLKLPRIYYVKGKWDLIHSARGFLILNHTPWIVDMEHVASFVGMNHRAIRQKAYKKKIEWFLNSKNCKKIIPHCKAAEKSLYSALDAKKFEHKIETIYPAFHPIIDRIKYENRDTINFIFVGRRFEAKGGPETIEAFEILTKKYDVKLTLISNPNNYYKAKIQKNTNIRLIETPVHRDIVINEYKKSDVFIMPTFRDTFGIVFLEAMAAGLPVIGTDIFAGPEIIQDGYNGFLVHSPYRWHDENFLGNPKKNVEFSLKKGVYESVVDEIVEKSKIIIEDDSLRKKMSYNAFKLITNGKFSIKERNKKLKKIYNESVE